MRSNSCNSWTPQPPHWNTRGTHLLRRRVRTSRGQLIINHQMSKKPWSNYWKTSKGLISTQKTCQISQYGNRTNQRPQETRYEKCPCHLPCWAKESIRPPKRKLANNYRGQHRARHHWFPKTRLEKQQATIKTSKQEKFESSIICQNWVSSLISKKC